MKSLCEPDRASLKTLTVPGHGAAACERMFQPVSADLKWFSARLSKRWKGERNHSIARITFVSKDLTNSNPRLTKKETAGESLMVNHCLVGNGTSLIWTLC